MLGSYPILPLVIHQLINFLKLIKVRKCSKPTVTHITFIKVGERPNILNEALEEQNPFSFHFSSWMIFSGEENKHLLVCLTNPEVSNWQLLFSQAAGLDELPAAFWAPDTHTSTRK